MEINGEVGMYMAGLRERAGFRQSKVAERAGMPAPVLSRMESGERVMAPEEMDRVLAAIGTPEALRFGVAVRREWQCLERPGFGHPDEEFLWKVEELLVEVEALREGEEMRPSFGRRLDRYHLEISRAARRLLNLNYSIALMGEVGVGKTTALCWMAGLLVEREGRGIQEILEVGGGRTTVCEVHVVQGPRYGVVVFPYSDEEVEREVLEFAHHLTPAVVSGDRVEGDGAAPVARGSSDPEGDFPGTSIEIARCIRNMTGLLRQPQPDGSGGERRVDLARELAREIGNEKALAAEIMTRMNLSSRRRREIWYPGGLGHEPKSWLLETFRNINNGRHPEVSLPRVIQVTMPDSVLGSEDLHLRLVDTKGVDQAVGRSDLEEHLSDPDTVVVLCSGFNDAPAVPVQEIMEQAARSRLADLDLKAAVLVLPRPEEAMRVKDYDGSEVESVEEGYALKREQAEDHLNAREIPFHSVEFFNCREETPDRIRGVLLDVVNGLRDRRRCEVTELVVEATAMLNNFEQEQVWAVQEEAAHGLKVWLDNNENLPELRPAWENGLLEAITSTHPATVRASVRRQGTWSNLEFAYHLGDGVRSMVGEVVRERIVGFQAVASNIEDDPQMVDAVNLVRQVRRMMETGSQQLLEKSRILGRSFHQLDMEPDRPLWERCDREWGEGIGYRDRVMRHNQEWFKKERSDEGGLDHRIRRFVEWEWKALVGSVRAILE